MIILLKKIIDLLVERKVKKFLRKRDNIVRIWQTNR